MAHNVLTGVGTYCSGPVSTTLTPSSGGVYLNPLGIPIAHTLLDREKCKICSRFGLTKCGLCVGHSMFRKKRIKKVYEDLTEATRDEYLITIRKQLRKFNIIELSEISASLNIMIENKLKED